MSDSYATLELRRFPGLHSNVEVMENVSRGAQRWKRMVSAT